MTSKLTPEATSAVGPTVGQRFRAIRWVFLVLAAVIALALLTAYLTAPRPGGRMDPQATSADGAHAIVALLRDHGVDVVEAKDIADVERAMRPDALLLVAETYYLVDDDALQRLADLPGDRLLVEPNSRTREALSPEVRTSPGGSYGGPPDCSLREAQRAGDVELGISNSYEAVDDAKADVTLCYEGAVARYTDGDRTVTVVGSADFMVNSGLLKQGNAALAMNLAGTQPRLVWYAPQEVQGESDVSAELTDLIPDRVTWIVLQLCVAVLLVAWWKARRVGPLVAEDLPVVVRASETVEGRGRLYRSRRARDRAADALRTATLQRIVPRLGLGTQSPPPTIVTAVATRTGADPVAVGHWLYGPTPATDTELVELSRQLDTIERQVATS